MTSDAQAPAGCWLVSRGFDLTWFVLPGLVSVVVVVALRAFGITGSAIEPAGFLLVVVAVDVAHVYATLLRTYLDPQERQRRKRLYVTLPLVVWLAGLCLHRSSPQLFWTLLAYVAVHHFVRQQEGFMKLYRHRAGESDRGDLVWDRVCVLALTLYPLLWWHANLPRNFSWFLPGDFLDGLPSIAVTLARPLFYGFLVAYAVRLVVRWRRGVALNPGKLGVLFATGVCWYGGILVWNDDLAFTLTNVVIHGVPYIGLVAVVGHRRRGRGGLGDRHLAARLFSWSLAGSVAVLWVGLALVAFLEEGLWDHLVWHEHGGLFGTFWHPDISPLALSLCVSLLTVPQATHYILDGIIWRLDGSNPGLGEDLGFAAEP